jgi:hypothetical protein
MSLLSLMPYGLVLLNFSSVIAAYIDPNTGGMLFQILAVMFGVISGALLLFSGRIKGMFYRLRRRFQEPEPDAIDEQVASLEEDA